MLTKIRNYFFIEEAEAAPSDKAVLILLSLSFALASFAFVVMGVS